jgi:uncharacterized phiE125 gp8 family phage protein
MPLILVTPPTGEPLSLAETKKFLRLDTPDDDVAVSDLITAARHRIEIATGLALLTQGWRLVLDDWPASAEIALALTPVVGIDEVRVIGADDVPETVDPVHYLVETASRPARLVLRTSRLWAKPGRAAGGIEIDFTAGYGAEPGSVPLPVRQAVMHLVTEAFENREGGERQAQPGRLSPIVAQLIAPYRRTRL